ncbi:hypothetical protein CA600_28685 [Paenibacillus sp. VTT E-133280]|uniref:hypothetical protein n=1 Tax=Paenibacillus sp. VTT E-133280 TaxID=1986222 RepID=UPI000BA0E2FC|nr:hypothetical protein [Paenibacillus sp. VTT E-133280]OZQ60313.1 hypothetical protein CA600_28685 [Paenibacillus sp. VTT E-133280]
MPRIERIRITGLKYEKMLKKYDDMILDLCNEEGPSNTLITLMNGGGKGVLLQSIFQLLMPKTPWGKDSENQVEAFFHNHKKQLKPYTFHIAIEWRLDNTERNVYMTTGIAMTAHNSLDQQDIKVDYLLYALTDYGETSELTLSTLPLFDEETAEPTSFETIQQFVRDRRGEIVPFGSHSSDLKRYYDFLATRDIHIAEWRNMRRINGEEGGIKGYFKKNDAFTNHNLFEKLIIPEIGSSLNESPREEDNTLQRMFIDTATVAQRLPMLEQREQVYTEFLGMTAPLYELVKLGVEAESTVQETELRGRQIYTVIHEELRNAEEERSKVANELAGRYQESKQLRFETDNLKYLRSKEEMELKQEEFNKLSDHQRRARGRLDDSKVQEKKLEVAHFLAKRMLHTRQIEQWQKEIQAIEGSLEMKERQEVIQAAKEKLRKQWDVVFILWEQTIRGFGTAERALSTEEKGLRKERESFLLELAGLDIQINELTLSIRQYSEELGAFAAQHGQEAAHASVAALQRTISAAKTILLDMEALEEQQKEAENQKLTLHKNHAELSEKHRSYEREADELGALLDTQTYKESQLWSQIVVLLEMFNEHNRLGATGLFEEKDAIQLRFIRKMDEVEQQTKRSRRDYYNQLMDVELQNQSYWLPNSDILAVKDTLDSLKIQSTPGSSYLNDRPYLEREEELERHPLLPYSLIVTRREADKIKPDLLKDTLLKSAVPIFIREEMAASDQVSFNLFANQGPQMVLEPDRFFNFKSGIQAKLKEQEQVLQDAEAYLSKLKSVRQEYERLYQTENTVTITAKRNTLMKLQSELQQSLINLDNEIDENEGILARIGRELIENKALSAEQEQRAAALQGWIERSKKHEQDQKEKKKYTDRKSLVSKELASKDKQLEHLEAQMVSLGGEREKWTGDAKYALFPRLQHWFPEIVFPTYHQLSDDVEVTSIDPVEQNLLLQQLSTVESLQQSLTENELEIRTRAAQIKAASENLTELEASLNQVDEHWRKVTEPAESTESIMAARNRQKSETASLEEDYQMIHDSFIRCQTELENLQKELRKVEKSIKEKHERAVEIWNELLEQKEADIQERIQENELMLNQCKRSLDRMDALIQTLSNQIKIMNAHIEDRVNLRTVPEELMLSVRESCESLVADWLLRIKDSRIRRDEVSRKVKEEKNSLTEKLAKNERNSELETKILDRLNTVHWDNFAIAQQVLDSMLRSSRDQIESIQSDKEEMGLSRKMWVARASYRVVQIIDIMKRMERRMIIHNENNYAFPLVRLNYKNINVPRTSDEVEPMVSDYFNRCIHELLSKYPKIEQVPTLIIKEVINDGRIVYAALQNRFPILQVYKPVTENYFLYAAPEDYHYSDWEIINRGALDEAVGSGGQRQSVQLLVAMMIMTHKRVNRENKGWTVFLYDNPFGEMVSNNVLDPVFEISKALKFQWLIVTPPELVKNDVSVRFGVYWQLYFGGVKGDMLESTLVKGGRKLIPVSLF